MIILNLNKRIVRVVYILTYSLLLLSVATKLFCIPYISDKFHVLGISEYCHVFGTIELVAVVAFIYPRTIGIGLMMLCSYFGGAIATDMQAQNYLYQPIVVLVFVFVTAVFRKPSLFNDNIKIKWDAQVSQSVEKI
jgi:hypothetical protein